MKKTSIKIFSSRPLILAIVMLAVAGMFFVGAPKAQAANGDLTVTITSIVNELGSTLSGGSWANVGMVANCSNNGAGPTNHGDGTYTFAAANLQSSPGGGCSNGDTIHITISGGSGYVEKILTFTNYQTGSENASSYNFTSGNDGAFQYTYKITAVTAEGTGASLISSLDSALVVGGATCTLNGGAYYCPVSSSCSSAQAYVVKDGYVAANYSLGSTGDCSSQVVTSASNVKYAVKITVTDELSSPAPVTGATVTAGTGYSITCTEGGAGIYYCPVPYAHIGTGANVLKPGYVQKTVSTDVYTDRTSDTSLQSTGVVTGVQYAHKVTVDSTAAGLGATVTAGSDNTSCTQDGSSYYCAITPAQDGNSSNDIHVSKSGYLTVHGTTANRAEDASGQAVENLTSTTVMGSSNLDSFGLKITVNDELGNSMTGITATFNTASPDFTAGNVYYWADTSGEHTLSLAKNGYVTKTASLTTSASAQNSQTYSAGTGIQYGYKITGITSETLSTALLSSATTVELGNSTGLDACILSSGTYYCPVVLANSSGTIIAHVAVDGYVEKSDYATDFSSRTGSTAQQSGTLSNILYTYKLSTFNAEATGSVTPSAVTVGDNTGTVSCTLSGGAWYCAVPAADSNGTVNANVASDGFVQADHAISSRSSATDAQVTDSISNILYAFKVTGVADELGNALSTVTVTAGDSYGTTCTESGSAWYCAVPLANTGITIKAEKDGYVTNILNSFTQDRTVATAGQETKAVTGVKFAHKVTITREGDGTPLTGATVTTGSVTCVESEAGVSGVYYCAVPIANDNATITVTKTGYETNTGVSTTDRTNIADDQGAETIANVRFQLKVVVTNELGTALPISGLSAISFNGSNPTYSNSNIAYWAIAPASNATLLIQKDGYVNSGTTNTGFVGGEGSGVTTSASSNQTVVTLGTGDAKTTATDDGNSATAKGLMYALKVTVLRDGDNSAITGSTVTAGGITGNPYTTTCAENASTGVHYCAIPLADTGAVVRIVKSDHVTKYLAYTDRTAVTNSQGTVTALLDAQDTSNASLAVTNISAVANPAGSTGYATADGTYNNGWAWTFNVTASTTQRSLAMEFSDFVNGANSIAVATSSSAGIIRYCSPEAGTYDCSDNSENSTTWRTLTGASSYGGYIVLNSDLDTEKAGRQVQVKVQMKVPYGTSGGSYSSIYGIKTIVPID